MRKLLPLLLIILIVAGCAGTPWHITGRWWDTWHPTELEKSFGVAYYQQLANQILNPDASKNLSPVFGTDGKSAQKALEMFRKSYEKEYPAPTYILNIGQGASVK